MHPKPLDVTEFQPLSLRCVLQSFLLFLLIYTINAWPNLVFKNDGERSDPGKYCPISLLISKIFESFINDSLTKHLDITGLSSDFQYGFSAFRSTAEIRTVLSERIYNLFHGAGEIRAIALDIVKAFNNAGLLHKLKAYGVVGPILSILQITPIYSSLVSVVLDLCSIVEWEIFL